MYLITLLLTWKGENPQNPTFEVTKDELFEKMLFFTKNGYIIVVSENGKQKRMNE